MVHDELAQSAREVWPRFTSESWMDDQGDIDPPGRAGTEPPNACGRWHPIERAANLGQVRAAYQLDYPLAVSQLPGVAITTGNPEHPRGFPPSDALHPIEPILGRCRNAWHQ
jgi:hypothetical protein